MRAIARAIVRGAVAHQLTGPGVGGGGVELVSPATLNPAVTFTRASTATYADAAGEVKVAAIDAPRYDYDPVSRAYLGLLIEGARTNLCPRSTLAGGPPPTGWVSIIGTGSTTPASSIRGLADGAVAHLQTATAQRPFYGTTVALAAAANSTYAMSVDIESVAGGVIANGMLRYAAIPAGAVVSYPVCPGNPAGGIAGNVAPGRLTVLLTTSTTPGLWQYYVGLGTGGAATGTVQFGRPQFELGGAASSFAPTTASAFTREADTATITNLSSIGFNASQGTLYVEGVGPPTLAAAATLASFNDNTANNVIRLHMNAGGSLRAQVIVSGVTVADLALGTLTARTAFTAAMTYTTDSIKGCLNGSTVQTDASATIPSVDRLMIGRGVSGDYWFGHIARLRYYPTIQDTQEMTA